MTTDEKQIAYEARKKCREERVQMRIKTIVNEGRAKRLSGRSLWRFLDRKLSRWLKKEGIKRGA